MVSEKINTESMSRFLKQVGEACKQDFIVMALGGASSYKRKKLQVSESIPLVFLLLYSPELNPAGQIVNVLRRDYFANKVFDLPDAAILQAMYHCHFES